VADVVYELKEFGMGVEVIDPYADPEEVHEEYGYSLIEQPSGKYHAVIVAVSHTEYAEMDEAALSGLLVQEGLVVDLKGLFRNKINTLNYWSL
jgi:UDP-N-acetyl-D-galactosamine dehydrogenase